eukprot:Clim_evm12s10 gene=Clim_evmTU12s10
MKQRSPLSATACAMVLLASVATAMPITDDDDSAITHDLVRRNDQYPVPREADNDRYYCSYNWTGWATNETTWNGYLPEKDVNATIGGVLDIRELAQVVAEQGSNFEDYIGGRLGNFSVQKSDGQIDGWRSFLFKLNAVTAPALMAPYYVERTEENAEKWDDWWDSLQALFPANQTDKTGKSMRGFCDGNATSKDYIPRQVSFPDKYRLFIPMNEMFETAPLDVRSSVWTMETGRSRAAPREFLARNNQNDCSESDFEYSEAVAQKVKTSSSREYSSEYERSMEVGVSSTVGVKMAGFKAEVTASMEAGLKETTGEAFSEEESSETKTTTEVKYSMQPQVPPNTILNVTMWADQVAADMYITGDLRWHDDYTGLQFQMEGHGKKYSGMHGDAIALINRGTLTTPGQIKKVLRKVSDVLDADWSDTFIRNLVTSSAQGKSEAQVGSSVLMDVYQCDLSAMDDPDTVRRCDADMAARYPVTHKCTKGRRDADEDGAALFSEGVRVNVAPIEGLPTDCYDYELVDAAMNRFAVHPRADCSREDADLVTDLSSTLALGA